MTTTASDATQYQVVLEREYVLLSKDRTTILAKVTYRTSGYEICSAVYAPEGAVPDELPASTSVEAVDSLARPLFAEDRLVNARDVDAVLASNRLYHVADRRYNYTYLVSFDEGLLPGFRFGQVYSYQPNGEHDSEMSELPPERFDSEADFKGRYPESDDCVHLSAYEQIGSETISSSRYATIPVVVFNLGALLRSST